MANPARRLDGKTTIDHADIDAGTATLTSATVGTATNTTTNTTDLNVNSQPVEGVVDDATAETATLVPFKVLRIPIAAAASDAENDTEIELPASALVYDVFVDVATAEVTGGTREIDIGLLSGESGGDANGFADALSVDATGLVRPQATVTTGDTETYYSANTRGVLLSDYLAGSDTDDDFGIYREKPFLTDSVTAKTISWTMGSADFDELAADIVILYLEV